MKYFGILLLVASVYITSASQCGNYDSTKQVCCASTLHPLDKTKKCCGYKYYRPTTRSACCNNRLLFSRTYHARCCGTNVYSTYYQLCRAGKVLTKPRCGMRYYTPNSRVVCCNRILRLLRYPVARCCGTSYYSTYNQYCRNNRRYNKPRCGTRYYIPGSRVICCGGRVTSVRYPYARCCASTPYSTYNQVCTNGKVLSKPRCGRRYYYSNPRLACCANKLMSTGRPVAKCCGNSVYSSYYQICSSGSIKSKPVRCGSQAYTPSIRNACCYNRLYTFTRPRALCCGSKGYTTYNQVCYNRKVVTKARCGNTMYVPTPQYVCCNSRLYRFRMATAKCCGTRGYSTYYQYCRGTSLVSLRRCGYRMFNPLSQLCCYNRVVNKSSSKSRCCGVTSYDYSKQVCCRDRRYTRKRLHTCCNRYYYLYSAQFCCGGYVGNRRTQKCCRYRYTYRPCRK